MSLLEAWACLAAPWRASFELAWEAFGAGTIPVGAVVVDASGAVLARGRNRVFEDDAPPRQLAGSRIAHAEVNALAQLPADGRYGDCTLYSTVEPCLLCVGAASLANLGRIAYAAPDLYGGGRSLAAATLAVPRGLNVELTGPLGDPFESFAEALHLAFFLTRSRKPRGLRTTYEDERPDLVPLARALLELRAQPLDAALQCRLL